MAEYLITVPDDKGRLTIIARFSPKVRHAGHRAQARLRALRKDHPKAMIWIRGENLE